MPLEREDTITTDVSKRLEELFEGRDRDELPPIPETFIMPEPEQASFDELESMVNAIGSRFSDSKINRYLSEIKTLKEKLNGQKIVLMHLRLLESLGKFIKNNGLNRDPRAIELLKKSFVNARRAAVKPLMPQAMQKKILYNDIMDYKSLKEIAGEKTREHDVGNQPESMAMATENEKSVMKQKQGTRTDESEGDPPDLSDMTPHEAFALALVEMQKMLKSEFSALRAELKMWREGQ